MQKQNLSEEMEAMFRDGRLPSPPARELYEYHYKWRMNVEQLSRHYGVSKKLIHKWLKEMRETAKEEKWPRHWLKTPTAEALYYLQTERGMTDDEIGVFYDVPTGLVQHWFDLRKYDLAVYTAKQSAK